MSTLNVCTVLFLITIPHEAVAINAVLEPCWVVCYLEMIYTLLEDETLDIAMARASRAGGWDGLRTSPWRILSTDIGSLQKVTGEVRVSTQVSGPALEASADPQLLMGPETGNEGVLESAAHL